VTLEVMPSIEKCKGCDIKGHTEEEYWKFHPKKCPKNFQNKNKEALLTMDFKERVDGALELEGKINFINLEN